MELNQECIRDLLIYIEHNQKTRSNGMYCPFKMRRFVDSEVGSKYQPSEITAAVQYLTDKKMIICPNPDSAASHIQIDRITATGRDYLGVIRDDNQWNTLLKKFGKIFSASGPVVIEMIIKGLLNIG